MKVYFVRHASAGLPTQDLNLDQRRKLDNKGIAQCESVGAALALMKTRVDTILSSPFRRTLQTAALIASAIRHQNTIVISPALHPNADYPQFRSLLEGYRGKKAIMVVGHDINLSGFLGTLLSGRWPVNGLRLQHAAVAVLKVTQRSAKLQCYLTPDLAPFVFINSAYSCLAT